MNYAVSVESAGYGESIMIATADYTLALTYAARHAKNGWQYVNVWHCGGDGNVEGHVCVAYVNGERAF